MEFWSIAAEQEPDGEGGGECDVPVAEEDDPLEGVIGGGTVFVGLGLGEVGDPGLVEMAEVCAAVDGVVEEEGCGHETGENAEGER